MVQAVQWCISKRVQRCFGNEWWERHRGRLSSTTWGIVIWEPSLILLVVVGIGAIIYMTKPTSICKRNMVIVVLCVMQCELKLELFPRVHVESFSAEDHMPRQRTTVPAAETPDITSLPQTNCPTPSISYHMPAFTLFHT